jgi:hypothetical protein
MKKNYVYFLPPLVALIVFGAIYWNFLAGYEKEQDRRTLAIKTAKDEKLQQQERDKKTAYDEAIAAQTRRKKEKEDKDAKEQADRDERQLAEDNLKQALRDEAKLADKIRSLNKEIETAKKEVAEVEENKKKAVEEEAFQRTYIKQAEANQKNLLAVLEKIQKADDDAAAAAKAAAAAAAKK